MEVHLYNIHKQDKIDIFRIIYRTARIKSSDWTRTFLIYPHTDLHGE